MSTAQQGVPAGYVADAKGRLVPKDKVKPIDIARDQVVRGLAEEAERMSRVMAEFKADAMARVAAFVSHSQEQYGVKTGGNKGNVSITTFDGEFKIVRQVSETISFDERLQAAKELIDQCLLKWAKGSNANIKALVMQAFQVDQEGKVNTGRILSLRTYDIDDPDWMRAMDAIADSMSTSSSKPYVRFYRRNAATGKYDAISLDLATV